jgi:hypothetical protein
MNDATAPKRNAGAATLPMIRASWSIDGVWEQIVHRNGPRFTSSADKPSTDSMAFGSRTAVASEQAIKPARPAPIGASRNDELLVSRQKLQRLLARREATKLAVVRFVLSGFGRPQNDELPAFLFDQRGEFLALKRRHVPRAAMRASVIAHAGPFIGPSAPATIAFVEVEKPGHASLLRSQAITTTRHEIDKSAIAQKLKLLAYLGLDVLVAGIEVAQLPLEGVDLVKREVALPE